jgi:hypothetical protein
MWKYVSCVYHFLSHMRPENTCKLRTRPRFDSWQGKIFSLSPASRPALEPTQPLSNGFRGLFLGGKAAGAWRWLLTSILCRGQEWRSYICTPPYVSMLWCLIKHRDRFTFFTSMVYLTMISVAEIIQHRMVNWRRFWREISVAWFKALTSHLPGWSEGKRRKTLIKISGYLADIRTEHLPNARQKGCHMG